MRKDDNDDIAPMFREFLPKPHFVLRYYLYLLAFAIVFIFAITVDVISDPSNTTNVILRIFMGLLPATLAFGSLWGLYICLKRWEIGRIIKRLHEYSRFISNTIPEQVTLNIYIKNRCLLIASCDAICDPVSQTPWVLKVWGIAPSLRQHLLASTDVSHPAALYRNDEPNTPMIAVINDTPIFLRCIQAENYNIFSHIDAPPRRLSVIGLATSWYIFAFFTSILLPLLSLTVIIVIAFFALPPKTNDDLFTFHICFPLFSIISAILLVFITSVLSETRQNLHLLRYGCVGIGVVENDEIQKPATFFLSQKRKATINIVSSEVPSSITSIYAGGNYNYQPGCACTILYDPDDPQCFLPLSEISTSLNACTKKSGTDELILFFIGILFLLFLFSMTPLLWWVTFTSKWQ